MVPFTLEAVVLDACSVLIGVVTGGFITVVYLLAFKVRGIGEPNRNALTDHSDSNELNRKRAYLPGEAVQTCRKDIQDLARIFSDPNGTLKAQLTIFGEEYLPKLDCEYDRLDRALSDLDALITRTRESAPGRVKNPGECPSRDSQKLKKWKKAQRRYLAYRHKLDAWKKSFECQQLQQTIRIRRQIDKEFKRCDKELDRALTYIDHLRADGYFLKMLGDARNDVEAQVEVIEAEARIEEQLKKLTEGRLSSPSPFKQDELARIIPTQKT